MKREGISAGEEILVLHERWVSTARKYLREIVATVVAIVLALFIMVGYRTYKERREAKAILLYAQTVSQKDQALGRQKLEELVRKYSGTIAAREALLNLWELDLKERGSNLEKRLQALKRGSPEEIRLSLLLAEAYLLEEKNRLQKAEKRYRKVLEKAPFSGVVVYADLARIYELMRSWPKALENYQKYLERRPPTGSLNFIEYKLAKIKEKLENSP